MTFDITKARELIRRTEPRKPGQWETAPTGYRLVINSYGIDEETLELFRQAPELRAMLAQAVEEVEAVQWLTKWAGTAPCGESEWWVIHIDVEGYSAVRIDDTNHGKDPVEAIDATTATELKAKLEAK